MVLGLLFLAGCGPVNPGVNMPIHGGVYSEFLGKRYAVVVPLRIMKYTDEWGSYFLATPQVEADQWTKVVAEVPAGAVLRVDHASRYVNFDMGTRYRFVGRFETRGIFNGAFFIDSFIKWRNTGKGRVTSATFKERFLGMNEAYLKELKTVSPQGDTAQ